MAQYAEASTDVAERPQEESGQQAQPEQAKAAPKQKPADTAERMRVRDSLHMLDMDILPLEMPGLRRARLVKNNQIQTMVELFQEAGTGSGQVDIADLEGFFPNGGDALKRDLSLIKRFEATPSFDVYTIRIVLRSLLINVEDQEALRLSPAKRQELTDRMKSFTYPLIKHVYGEGQTKINDVSDVLALFTNPDPREALAQLRLMAQKLNIQLAEIPRFLEDYGDIFLSLAYFKEILDDTVPLIQDFQVWLGELRSSYAVRNDRAQSKILDGIDSDLSDIAGSITGRFESFDRKTADFWDDISADRFHAVRELITSHHMTVGGVLCGLSLKMDAWKKKFPTPESGGPQQRLEFTRSEILPGLGYIKKLEQRATMR